MATIRRITQTNPVSGFSSFQPRSGGAFDLLATAAETALEVADPLARRDAAQMGKAAGYEAAKGTQGAMVSGGGGSSDGGLTFGAKNALSTLEEVIGSPLNVISGYRDPEHNARVGGAKNSQHTHGNAYDVDVSGMSQEQRISLIEQARAAGFSGIGVYDNSLHFDVGGDRAWGPSYGRDSLPEWAAGAVTAPLGGRVGEPVMSSKNVAVTTSTGQTRGIAEATFSGPYKALYDNAAAIAYQAEILDKGAIDLQEISLNFAFDPEGYASAADTYVRDMVSRAPDEMKPDIEASLVSDARRRVLGIQADKLDDIRRRANNSSAALVDRYSNAYAEAVAAQDPDAALEARTQLDSVLRAREGLPGVGWTPEQSANEFINAERRAAQLMESNRTARSTEIKDNLQTAIEAATAMRSSVDEGVAFSEEANAQYPELAAEARALIQLRQTMPEFATMPQAQRDAAEANLLAQPVSDKWEVGFGSAVQKANERISEGWAERTIETAQEYMGAKPPALVDMTMESPEEAIDAFARRRAYVNGVLAPRGLTDEPLYLSQQEAEGMKAILDITVDPSVRAAVALGIVQGFGADAQKVFGQIGIDDPVLKMGAILTSNGADPTVLTQALQGQTLIRENAVTLPKEKDMMAAEGVQRVAAMFQQIPGGTQKISDVMALANSLYASQALGVDPESETGIALMERSTQRALGMQEWDGYATGGIQGVFEQDVFLPADVAPEELELAISRAFTLESLGPYASASGAQVDQSAWAAAGGVPYIGNTPLDPGLFQVGMVQIIPISKTKYRMEIRRGSAVIPITTAEGNLYALDVNALIAATGSRMARIKPR